MNILEESRGTCKLPGGVKCCASDMMIGGVLFIVHIRCSIEVAAATVGDEDDTNLVR